MHNSPSPLRCSFKRDPVIDIEPLKFSHSGHQTIRIRDDKFDPPITRPFYTMSQQFYWEVIEFSKDLSIPDEE